MNKVLAQDEVDALLRGLSDGAIESETDEPEDDSGMKGIGYILQDGNATQKIVFWYATQEAADLTKTIMESIEETEPV